MPCRGAILLAGARRANRKKRKARVTHVQLVNEATRRARTAAQTCENSCTLIRHPAVALGSGVLDFLKPGLGLSSVSWRQAKQKGVRSYACQDTLLPATLRNLPFLQELLPGAVVSYETHSCLSLRCESCWFATSCRR